MQAPLSPTPPTASDVSSSCATVAVEVAGEPVDSDGYSAFVLSAFVRLYEEAVERALEARKAGTAGTRETSEVREGGTRDGA